MSKTQRKTHSEIEHLRAENRKLSAELRRVRRQLRDFEKREHFYEDIVDEIIEENSDVEMGIATCVKCKHPVIELDFKQVLIRKCENCGHQERKKI